MLAFDRAGIQQLGDAEIEQLRLAIRIDQNVAGLEVAVDHEMPMRRRDRACDLDDQLHALLHIERLGAHVLVDAYALHVLHREKRAPVLGGTGVDQARDMRMIERGQDLTLAMETLHVLRGARKPRQHPLQRDALLHAAEAALGEIDHAHAAATDFGQDLVTAEPGQGARCDLNVRADVDLRQLDREQVLDFSGEIGVAIGCNLDVRRSLCRRQRQRLHEDALRRAKALLAHGRSLSARLSQARACTHSALTVEGCTSSASAVSASVRPAK